MKAEREKLKCKNDVQVTEREEKELKKNGGGEEGDEQKGEKQEGKEEGKERNEVRRKEGDDDDDDDENEKHHWREIKPLGGKRLSFIFYWPDYDDLNDQGDNEISEHDK